MAKQARLTDGQKRDIRSIVSSRIVVRGTYVYDQMVRRGFRGKQGQITGYLAREANKEEDGKPTGAFKRAGRGEYALNPNFCPGPPPMPEPPPEEDLQVTEIEQKRFWGAGS